MKKIFKAIVCLLVVVTLTGCGSKMTLEQFAAENQAKIESKSSLYKSELVARDNSLVVKTTYTKTYTEAQIETMKKSISNSNTQNSSMYYGLLNEVRKDLPKTKSVIIEFYNGDGTLISSREFK